MTSRRKSVAVVMPVRNEERSVVETLDAIFASTRLPDEIVVADGLSTDGTVEAILAYADRRVPIRIVENPTVWCGGGRNVAIRKTDCDVIVLSDFGNTIEPGYIEHIVRPFEQDDTVEIVGGLFKMRARTDFEHCVASIHYFEDYTLDRLSRDEISRLIPEVAFSGGLCTAFTRRIWAAVGEQPEWLAKGQDKLFSRKVYAFGGKGVIALDARVNHHVRRTPGALFRQLLLYGRGNGQMRFISKHAVKLAAIYGTFAALLLLGFVSRVFPAAAGLLFIAYLWRAGLRKVMRVDGGLRKLRYVPLSALVLVARDVGSLLGHALGWAEWLLVPRYRRLYRSYMAGLPADRVPLVAPRPRPGGPVRPLQRSA